MRWRFVFPLFPLLLVSAVVANAQLPGSSARALGMAGAYDLSARGFEASAWNPATLGLANNPAFSIGLPQGNVEFGSNAYGLGDLMRYGGTHLTAADKASLLGRIDSMLDVRMLAQVSAAGMSVGRFAVSFASSGAATVGIGRDAVELALVGNGSRSGPGEYFSAAHSHGSVWAMTTLAVSMGIPISIPAGRLALGVTAKRAWGQGLARASELSSRLEVNPGIHLSGAGHALYTSGATAGGLLTGSNAPGNGYAMDVGAALALPSGLTLGVVAVNAIAAMRWDAGRLRYERASYVVTPDSSGGFTETQVRTSLSGAAIDGDPAARALKDSLLAESRFTRLVRGSASWRRDALVFSAEGMVRLSRGLDRQPAQSVALGAEYLAFGFLPLRAGIASDFSDSFALSGGMGLDVGPARLDLGAATISGTDHPGIRVGVGLSLWFGVCHAGTGC